MTDKPTLAEGQRIILTNNHPWAGEIGTIVEANLRPRFLRTQPFKVRLETGMSGHDVYAHRHHLKAIEGPIAKAEDAN